MSKPSGTTNDSGISIRLIGGSIGAAGWIFGMAFGLVRGAAAAQPRPAGIDGDISLVYWCAWTVFLIGLLLAVLGLFGLRLSRVFACETLLGASFVFGTIALVWMDAHGVLPLAVLGSADDGQPGSEIWVWLTRHLPTRLAYGAPLLLLGFMAATWWPRSRKWLLGADTAVQRSTPERVGGL
jgi:hypothetical protein